MTNDVQALISQLRKFVSERHWDQFHDPKNLAMCLASEAGELLAELRWVTGTESDEHCRGSIPRARIAAELGDIGIAWLLLCDRVGLDPLNLVREKLRQNGLKYPVGPSRGRPDPPLG